jgi:RNA 2',3'-cyclic 3'-phosphodiesterase
MSRGATARLFVAVDPPPRVREELAAWAREAVAGWCSWPSGRTPRAPRVIEPGALHLTVCFLGGRPVEEIDALAGALGACARPLGELAVGAPVWLPPRRPRALAVEIRDESGELERLHDAVERELALVCGLEPQRRRFRAHITVARMGGGERGARERRAAPMLAPTPRLRFVPGSVVLYRSWLAPTGASYEAIASFPLDVPPPA